LTEANKCILTSQVSFGVYLEEFLSPSALDAMKRCHDKTELVYWSFAYGLYNIRVNDKWCKLTFSGTDNAELVCSEQFCL